MLLASISGAGWSGIALGIVFLALNAYEIKRGRGRAYMAEWVGAFPFFAVYAGGIFAYKGGVLVYYLIAYAAIGVLNFIDINRKSPGKPGPGDVVLWYRRLEKIIQDRAKLLLVHGKQNTTLR